MLHWILNVGTFRALSRVETILVYDEMVKVVEQITFQSWSSLEEEYSKKPKKRHAR